MQSLIEVKSELLLKYRLKRDSRQQKRPNFVCFVCCFGKLCSVPIARFQWKDIVKFHMTFRDFLLEPNTISDKRIVLV